MGNGILTAYFLCMGSAVPDREKSDLSSGKKVFSSGLVSCTGNCGAGYVRLYHAGNEQCGADRMQCDAEYLWRRSVHRDLTILNSVREILSMPVSGITSGAQPVLGFNYGAKQYERIKKGIRFMTFVGSVYTVLAWAVLVFFPKPFLALFTGNKEMIENGVRAVHLYFAGFVFMLFQFSGQSVFVCAGEIEKSSVFFTV